MYEGGVRAESADEQCALDPEQMGAVCGSALEGGTHPIPTGLLTWVLVDTKPADSLSRRQYFSQNLCEQPTCLVTRPPPKIGPKVK